MNLTNVRARSILHIARIDLLKKTTDYINHTNQQNIDHTNTINPTYMAGLLIYFCANTLDGSNGITKQVKMKEQCRTLTDKTSHQKGPRFVQRTLRSIVPVIGSELKNICLAPAMTFNINDFLRINSDSTLKPRRVLCIQNIREIRFG